MKILVTDNPTPDNDYIESLISAYLRAGQDVTTGADEFFFSDSIPDVLHIHWPESLYRWRAPKGMSSDRVSRMIVERLDWYKDNGVTIINTIHNLAPHNNTLDADRQVYRQIIEHADILVHHCSDSIRLFAKSYPAASSRTNIVCPHGDYLIHYKAVAKDKARSRYTIPKDRLVILNFGRQRPYKNERFITTVFNNLAIKSKYLVIAGVFEYPDVGRWLRMRNRFRKRFPYRDRKYIYRMFPPSEIPDIISGADIIFLGQQHALNSGLLPLAATYSKPVVCPDIGCFKQSMEGWLCETYIAGDVDNAVLALQNMCKELPDLTVPDNSDWLRNNSWDGHVNGILRALPDRMDS
jgi:beta-1,4-mannosyltransferase